MSKQNQSAESQADKKNKRAAEPAVNQPAHELANASLLPAGPLAAAGDGSIEDQAARLGDSRFLTAQRWAMATQIGRVQGNRHLQRVIASLQTVVMRTATSPDQLDEAQPGDAGEPGLVQPPLQRLGPAAGSTPIQRQAPGGAPAAPAVAPAGRSMLPFAQKISSDDPEHLRQILEGVATEHGLKGAKKFVDDFQSDPVSQAGDAQLVEKIKAGLRTQMTELESKTEKMLTEFERTGLNVVSEMLNKSEEILQGESEKYGIKQLDPSQVSDSGLERAHMHEQGGTGRYTVEDNEKTRGMAEAAAQLAPKRKELDELIAQQQALVEELPVYVGHGKTITDQKKYDELGAQIKEKEIVYKALREKLEADYPILATYAGEKGGAAQLEMVARGPGVAGEMMASVILEKLKNIERVREGVANDEIKIWKLPTIMNGTKAQLGYAVGTLGHKLVDERAESITTTETLINLATAAISIALGLVAALPTAGASLGVLAAAGGATAVGLGISGYQAFEALREYQLAQAMSGSDADKAKAISQEDPSLFWLALDIIGVIVDLHGAMQVFKKVGPAVREALAARRTASEISEEAAEGAEVVAKAKQASQKLKETLEGQVPKPVADKIVSQVEGPQKGWLIDPDKPMSSGGFAGSLANKPGCGVFEGYIPSVPDKTVVIKVYPADDPHLIKVFETEKEGAAAAAKTSKGPKYYGEVDMGKDKRAFAMEKVSGDMPEDMSEGASAKAGKEASKAAQSINLKTLEDVRAYGRELWERGYYSHGDLQGLIDSAGNWRPIDFQGVWKRPPIEDIEATADALKQHNWQINEYNNYLIKQMPGGPHQLPPAASPPPRPVQPYREDGNQAIQRTPGPVQREYSPKKPKAEGTIDVKDNIVKFEAKADVPVDAIRKWPIQK